jgi:glycosyltransferase involved in cell wall biosynthesis
MPQLKARPLCLLFGVTSRREARFMVAAAGSQVGVRILSGSMTGSLIAAIARIVDVFAVPVSAHGAPAGDAGLLMALSVGGVPVVSNATARDLVLAHEPSGLMVEPGDEHGFIDAVDGLLDLPAIQRHFLGEDMARSLLQERPWRPVAQAYAERFAALVGRPQIPVDLRAA